jgi:hypothetical protein
MVYLGPDVSQQTSFDRGGRRFCVSFSRAGSISSAEADAANSGGTIAYLSSGVTAELATGASAFIFVQLPVYQRVNGLQLEPRWLLSLGFRWRL